MHQKVVIVAGAEELRGRLFEALDDSSAEAVEVPSIGRALELIQEIPVHLLVLQHPLDGMKLTEFMERFRERGGASQGAQVLMLAPGRSIGGLRRSAGSGVALVRSDIEPEELSKTFSKFLRRSPRFEENLLIAADIVLANGRVRKMLQVRNLSEGGMLLQTRTALEVGTLFTFELGIPELKRPILGKAEVVRVIESLERTNSGGVGVRIVSFVGDGRERLAKFLRVRKLPAAMSR